MKKEDWENKERGRMFGKEVGKNWKMNRGRKFGRERGKGGKR